MVYIDLWLICKHICICTHLHPIKKNGNTPHTRVDTHIVAHTCNASTCEDEAGGSEVSSQHVLHNDRLPPPEGRKECTLTCTLTHIRMLVHTCVSVPLTLRLVSSRPLQVRELLCRRTLCQFLSSLQGQDI